MEWTPGGTSEDVEDRRGEGGGGGGFGFGGGGIGIVGFVVLLVISLVTGRNYLGSFLMGNSGGSTQQVQQGPVQESTTEKRDVQLLSYVLDSDQQIWAQNLPQQTGKQYRKAHLVLFRGSTQAGCGMAQSATGPFYCPADEKVYIDLSFWNELKQLGGDVGDFAQGYVLAHELGHHVQNILGTEAQVERTMRSGSKANAMSVKLELQADCYAGIWGHNMQEQGKLDEGDVEAALKAATAVGDDHLQKMQGQAVSPESFTHGSSAQRIAWFKRGMENGQVSACNTFSSGGSDSYSDGGGTQ